MIKPMRKETSEINTQTRNHVEIWKKEKNSDGDENDERKII